MIPLIRGTRVVKLIETESGMGVSRDWEEGIVGSYSFMGSECRFCKTKSVLEMMVEMVAQQRECT